MLRSSGEQVSLVQLLILPNIWPSTWDFVIVLITNECRFIVIVLFVTHVREAKQLTCSGVPGPIFARVSRPVLMLLTSVEELSERLELSKAVSRLFLCFLLIICSKPWIFTITTVIKSDITMFNNYQHKNISIRIIMIMMSSIKCEN